MLPSDTPTQPLSHIERTVNEMSVMLKEVLERLRKLELESAAFSPTITPQIAAAWRKLDDQEQRLKKLEAEMVAAKMAIGATQWAGGIALAAVIMAMVGAVLKIL